MSRQDHPSAMQEMLASIRRAIHEEAAYSSVGLQPAQLRKEGSAAGHADAAPSLRGAQRTEGGETPLDDLRQADDISDAGPDLDELPDGEPFEARTEPPPAGGEAAATRADSGMDALAPATPAPRRRRAGAIGGVMGGRLGAGEALARLGREGGEGAQGQDDLSQGSPAFLSGGRGADMPADPPAGMGAESALDDPQGGSWWPETDEDFLHPDNDAADVAFVADAAPRVPSASSAAQEAPAMAARPPAGAEREALLSPPSASAAAAAFARLKRELGHEGSETLESLLRPMLREWLDAHLPALVERLVREEISRIAHGGED